jgi:hypothetical protein
MLRSVLRSALVLPLLAGPAMAVPVIYEFVHSGFAEGARVEGGFIGEDLNGNGFIETARAGVPGEVESFSLTFSGNSLVPAFGFAQPPRDFTLVYVLGSGGFANSVIPGFSAYDGVLIADVDEAYIEYATGLQSYADGGDCKSNPPCGTVVYIDESADRLDFSEEFATVTAVGIVPPPIDPPAPVPLAPAGMALMSALGALGVVARAKPSRRRAG